MHTSQGPLLLSVWYRPPSADAELIHKFEEEWRRHSVDVMGTVVIGDMNVHHLYWLKYSRGTSPAGRKLYAFCGANNFEERVKQPTHDGNLLDLVLTDMPAHVTATVHPKLADHAFVVAKLSFDVPHHVAVEREFWQFHKADWNGFSLKNPPIGIPSSVTM